MSSPSRIVANAVHSIAVALLLATAMPAAAATITVMTYNTEHGGLAKTPATTDAQISAIASQNPDVVVLQETYNNQLTHYVNGLNARLGTTAWHGAYSRHCMAGTAPTCTTWAGDNVMILTRLATLSTDPILVWAKDDYRVARGAIQMTVALSDGTPVHVFGCHLPANSDAKAARMTYLTTLQAWAQSFAGPRLVGGDFNDTPDNASIGVMTQQYNDAWALGGTGLGYTHSHDGVTATTRIDYWFSDVNGTAKLASVKVVGSLANSDHLAVVAAYNVGSTPPPPTATVLLDDRFDAFVSAAWPYGIFTSTPDSSIALAVTGTFRIGPLKSSATGSHYSGISSGKHDLTNSGSAYVQLVQAPNTATLAYAMFAAGSDASNFYRWYEAGNALVAEKKVSGTKTTLVNLPYDSVAHQFLRIRRESTLATGMTDVVFETAPNNAGAPGTFTMRYREAWDAHVVPSAVKFELKAGTSGAVISPGTVSWDNFHASANPK